MENEGIQENQETDFSSQENEVSTDESNVQNQESTELVSTELVQVDYQQHMMQSLDNNNTMLICSFVFLGVLAGILLSKTFWRRFYI